MAKGKYERWLEPDGLILLEGWARNGLTKEQIAHNVGINVKTLYDWEHKYPPICNALKKGKEVVVLEVENALLKRALGYSYVETRREVDADGKKKVVRTEKQVLPDTTAQIFYLKNQCPERWRDRQNIELSSSIDDSAKEMEAYFERQKKASAGPTVE